MHKGKKQEEKERQQLPHSCLFFQPSSKKLKQKECNSSTSSSSTTIDSLIISLSVSKAEIRWWVLKVVSSSFSLRSCLNLNAFLKEMFSDGKISENFKLSKTKCGYYLTYGIAPYLKSSITKSIFKAPYFTIMFDESLNSVFTKW